MIEYNRQIVSLDLLLKAESESRCVLGWVRKGVCIGVPGLGVVFFFFLSINAWFFPQPHVNLFDFEPKRRLSSLEKTFLLAWFELIGICLEKLKVVSTA